MLRAIKIATLAAFVQIVEGHVRALPTDAGFGCRDCNGGAAPGPFRTNGPLGAPKAFGANGASKVKEGDEITLKIGYNGGHQSNTLNFFNVRYSCGDSTGAQGTFRKAGTTNKDQINCNAPCKQLTAAQITSVDNQPATTANYPVDATNSNPGGYEVKFAMPEIEGTGDARQCTFSLVEGRDWGAAWDFEVEPKNTGAPGAGAPGGQQPVQPPPQPPKSVQGTFTFTPQNCQNDAPGCQCLTGSIKVYHTADAANANVIADIVGYPQQIFTADQKNKGAWSADYVLSRCGIGDQELDLTLAPDAQSTTGAILNVGVIANVPTVCGHIVKSTPLQAQAPGQQQQPIPNCPQCADLPFTDLDGYGCADFQTCANNALWRIQPLLHYEKTENKDPQTGKSARDQCCGCGGGTTKRQPIPPPTPAPTLAPVVGQPVVGQPVVGQPGIGQPGQPGYGQPGQPGYGQPGFGVTTRGGMFGGGAFVSSAPGMDLAFGVVLTIFAGLFM